MGGIAKLEIDKLIRENEVHKVVNLKMVCRHLGFSSNYNTIINNLRGEYSTLKNKEKTELRDFIFLSVKTVFQRLGSDVFLINHFQEELKEQEEKLKNEIISSLDLSDSQKEKLNSISSFKSYGIDIDDLNVLYKMVEA